MHQRHQGGDDRTCARIRARHDAKIDGQLQFHQADPRRGRCRRAGRPADPDRRGNRRPDRARQGHAGSRVDIARSGIGVAVRSGAPRPDISTPEALRRALLAAKTVSYSMVGASGIYTANVLIPRLGIAEEMKSRALLSEPGHAGRRAARDRQGRHRAAADQRTGAHSGRRHRRTAARRPAEDDDVLGWHLRRCDVGRHCASVGCVPCRTRCASGDASPRTGAGIARRFFG